MTTCGFVQPSLCKEKSTKRPKKQKNKKQKNNNPKMEIFTVLPVGNCNRRVSAQI